MGNSDRPFKVFEVGSLVCCHESVYLGASVDVFDAREGQHDAREDGQSVFGYALGQSV